MLKYVLLASFLCSCHGARIARKGVLVASVSDTTAVPSVEVREQAAADPVVKRHPFPSFRLADIHRVPAITCSLALFIAGIICAAGGLGGGGIYVTVLMVAGHLSPHDAVPLSKAIVFMGTICPLMMNLRKSVTQTQGETGGTGGALVEVEAESLQPLIDFNICRLVVPSALLGTLMGVILNSQIPSWVIVALLCVILMSVAFMSGRACWIQWCQETGRKEATDQPALTVPPSAAELQRGSGSDLSAVARQSPKNGLMTMQGSLLRFEGLAAFTLLAVIVTCGVFRAHAKACRLGLTANPGQVLAPESCRAPVVACVFGETFLTGVMGSSEIASVVLVGCLLVPLCFCLAALIGYGTILVQQEGFAILDIVKYSSMGLAAGMFAGLVGIGGGLIFAPFFLFMGLEPSTAVATSGACIIFTSSSTCFQFLLTDRIIVPLALVFGLANVAASHVGTTLVHTLHDRWHARKSYISFIVCLGVFASVFLSIYKLMSMGVLKAA